MIFFFSLAKDDLVVNLLYMRRKFTIYACTMCIYSSDTHAPTYVEMSMYACTYARQISEWSWQGHLLQEILIVKEEVPDRETLFDNIIYDIYFSDDSSAVIFSQLVIDDGGLPCIYQLIAKSQTKPVKKEACWMLSNITGGNQSQIQVKFKWVQVYYLILFHIHASAKLAYSYIFNLLLLTGCNWC